MSLPTVSAQQTAASLTQAANDAASGASTAGSATAQTTAQTAMGSLSGNFQTFLKMLMTQLQNQDPTSPLDTNQFTSQLVQFSSVEQQINTNSSLTQLIQLTQAAGVLQSTSMVGHKVSVTSDHLALQSGSAALQFAAPSKGPVAIAVYNDNGTKITDAVVDATAGSNTWNWDGRNVNGTQLPDGSYRVAVMGAAADGTTQALPFSVTGTATGVQQNGGSLTLQLGALSVDFSAVKSILN
ncbi:MAG: flagellar hook assembly protein FlgD [Rhodospirillales bacterium]|nr:flagellar hook assembly protein FlgD [Rhodospirillales bacterium]